MDPEQRKDVVRRIVEDGWNRADFDGLVGALSDYAVFRRRGREEVTGLRDLEEIVRRWRSSFPDMTLRIDEMVAEGDIVAVRLTFQGTHSGPWRGIPPTGARASFEVTWFLRFADSTIIELHEVDDEFGLRDQLGGTATGA
jgi:predicted ester cyclase